MPGPAGSSGDGSDAGNPDITVASAGGEDEISTDYSFPQRERRGSASSMASGFSAFSSATAYARGAFRSSDKKHGASSNAGSAEGGTPTQGPSLASLQHQSQTIQTLRIHRFKGLQDFEMQMGGVTILHGGNNSYKTTILQALNLISRASQCLPQKDVTAIVTSIVGSPERMYPNNKPGKDACLIRISAPGASRSNTDFVFTCKNNEKVTLEARGSSPPSVRAEMLTTSDYLPPTEEPLASDPDAARTFILEEVRAGRASSILRSMALYAANYRQDRWSLVARFIQETFDATLQQPRPHSSTKYPILEYSQGGGINGLNIGTTGPTHPPHLDISQSGAGMRSCLLLLLQLCCLEDGVLLLDGLPNSICLGKAQSFCHQLAKCTAKWAQQLVLVSNAPEVMDWAASVSGPLSPYSVATWWCSPFVLPRQLIAPVTINGFAAQLEAASRGKVLYCNTRTNLTHLLHFTNTLQLSHTRLYQLISLDTAPMLDPPSEIRAHFQKLVDLRLRGRTKLTILDNAPDREREGPKGPAPPPTAQKQEGFLGSLFSKKSVASPNSQGSPMTMTGPATEASPKASVREDSLHQQGVALLDGWMRGLTEPPAGLQVVRWRGEIENCFLRAKEGLYRWVKHIYTSRRTPFFIRGDTPIETVQKFFWGVLEDSIPADAEEATSGFHGRNPGSTLLEEAFHRAHMRFGAANLQDPRNSGPVEDPATIPDVKPYFLHISAHIPEGEVHPHIRQVLTLLTG